jgi:hypothetical protein
MDLEQLHIKLGISGTYWDKRPIYNILFNDKLLYTQEIKGESDEVEYIEFDVEYSTDPAVLKIQLTNKQDSDTVQNAEKTDIVNDMLLNIVSIEINEIDLDQIPWRLSDYYPNHRPEQSIKNCVNLGWNGTWELRWTNPFYIWLLENL